MGHLWRFPKYWQTSQGMVMGKSCQQKQHSQHTHYTGIAQVPMMKRLDF